MYLAVRKRFVKRASGRWEDVVLAIEALTNILNEHYLIAERLMSLSHPKPYDLKAAVNKVNGAYKNLLKSLSSVSVEPETVVAISQNKVEFDNRYSEWVDQTAAHLSIKCDGQSNRRKRTSLSQQGTSTSFGSTVISKLSL